jgi:hypothetical protein
MIQTDYIIQVECHAATDRKSCETCRNASSCQYFIEIFDHHSNYKHTIRNKRLTNFTAEICKYYETTTTIPNNV